VLRDAWGLGIPAQSPYGDNMARKRQKKVNALDDLKYKLQKSEFFKNKEITVVKTPGKKLSAALLEFIAPYDDPTFNKDAYERLAAMAVVAWNAAILKGKERRQLLKVCIDAIVASSGEEWHKETEKILAMMIKRKEQFFADDERHILEYSVVETKTHRNVAVSSLLRSVDSLSESLED
jgi:hypothetical protein